MNIPIKFRAKNRFGQKFYGTFDEDNCVIEDWDITACHAVERDTVCQLVGYDADGKEIYEGDPLISGDGVDCGTARLTPTFAVGESAAFNLTPDFIKRRHITLREGDGNA